MSQDGSSRRRRRTPPELIAVFDRETRRMGSVATLHNHAVAEFAGLHQTDQECIDLLDWTGPLIAGEIGAHLGLTSGAVTGLIDRLELAGWVHRERDPADRRRVIVRLADHVAGGESLWELYRPLAEAMESYRDQLDPRELRTVVEFLEFANETIAAATQHARRLRRDRTPGRS
jgi:DNA-binding MarR family transcriptional regulator